MSDVSVTFLAGSVPTADDFNTLANELIGFATAVDAGSLLGGITSDLLSDKYAPAPVHITLLPFTSGADASAPAAYTLPAASTVFDVVQPMVKPGWECFLAGYRVRAIDVDSANTDTVQFRIRRNGTTTIGGQTIDITVDSQWYQVANVDPFGAPATALADGEYLDIEMWSAGGAQPRGVFLELTFKYQLVGG